MFGIIDCDVSFHIMIMERKLKSILITQNFLIALKKLLYKFEDRIHFSNSFPFNSLFDSSLLKSFSIIFDLVISAKIFKNIILNYYFFDYELNKICPFHFILNLFLILLLAAKNCCQIQRMYINNVLPHFRTAKEPPHISNIIYNNIFSLIR